MKKIVVILLTVLLVIGVVIGLGASPYRIYPAYINDVEIWADGASPPQYYLRVVAGGPTTCWEPWRYHITRFGNMIFVQVLTLHDQRKVCGLMVTWVEKIIPLGNCFILGMIHAVVVNAGIETFVAGRCKIKE